MLIYFMIFMIDAKHKGYEVEFILIDVNSKTNVR